MFVPVILCITSFYQYVSVYFSANLIMLSAGTGYGPRKPQLYFDGDPERFELFLVKFNAHLRLNKLLDVLSHTPSGKEGEAAHQERNAVVFAELVQSLDDKSLSLIIRDASDDGRKALKILREHYLRSTKPRIISLYCELTSLYDPSSRKPNDGKWCRNC